MFGDIRRFHIPLLDEIEKAKATKTDELGGFKKFNFNSEHQTFDVYLMYKDYVGFVNAMNGLRGMKLVKCRKDEDFKTEYIEHDIKLNFDKSKHLSDKAIRRRQIAKKYGINTLEDLNEYKKKAKERKALLVERMKALKRHKRSSRNLLDFLARLVAVEEAKREQEELKALNERLLKERLIEEEKKLRNKLIERQRSMMMEKLKGKQDDVQETNGSAFDHSRDSYDRSDADYREHSDRPYGHSNGPNRYHPHDEYGRKPEFVFKNPRINPYFNSKFGHSHGYPHGNQTNHFNSFNGHSDSFHGAHQPNDQHRGEPRPNQPHQTNFNHRNTFPYNKKSNYYDDYQERSDYPDRASYAEPRYDYGPERYEQRSGHRSDRFDRPDRFDQQTGYRDRPNSLHARAGGPPDQSDYREQSGSYRGRSYQERDNYPERGNYQERSYQARGGYPERGGYPGRVNPGYPERSNYREKSDYRERPYEKSYDRPFERSNSFNRTGYRAQDEDSRSDEKNSTRPKSLVVLPQK